MTDSVKRLVEESGYPNMKVIEFAFDERDTGNASDYQSLNTVCHISKVFCDDLPVTKTCGNCTEQIDSRSFFPPSVFCCRIAIRNCIRPWIYDRQC